MSNKIKLEFKDWDYTCGDGCCYDYGVDVYLNGELLEDENNNNINGDDAESTVKYILKKLNYEVEIIR